MAVSPESMPDFRAPPPSPIASGRRSSSPNDHILSEFLEQSVRVPDLVLPDKVFPKHRVVENPPTIDLAALQLDGASHSQVFMEAIATMGCFQVVNHGIREEVVKQSMAAASRIIFGVPPDKRAAVTWSSENPDGFEEDIEAEEFVWCDNEKSKSEMEGVCHGYWEFREAMKELRGEVESVGERIVKVMMRSPVLKEEVVGNGVVGGVWYLKKHKRQNWDDGTLRNEGIRRLIRGLDHIQSHALCLHICGGYPEFHVYSKRKWVSFSPASQALIVTLGDVFMSEGKYRRVVGRAVYTEETAENEEECISMAFLYTDVERKQKKKKKKMKTKGKSISLAQQLHFALFLTLLFRFLLYLYNK